MAAKNALFYLISFLLVQGSLLLVFSKQAMLSLVVLILLFLLSSCLLVLLECEFLAMLFIVIYAGAVAVLFMFAVMMLESKSINSLKNKTYYVPVSAFFGLILLAFFYDEMVTSFGNTTPLCHTFYFNTYTNYLDLADSTNDVEIFGQILYSYYALHFLVTGLILLLALLGVVHLTKDFNKGKKFKKTELKQLSRNSYHLPRQKKF